MRKCNHLKLPVFLLLITSILASCEKSSSQKDLPGDPVNIPVEPYQQAVIDSANNFALTLFRSAFDETAGNANILISPFSVSGALSMTLNGAAGQTFEDMRNTLGFGPSTLEQVNQTYLKLMTEMVPVDSRVVLEIANSVWVEKKFQAKEAFIDALESYYLSETHSIDITDPSAVKTVNDWIAAKTHDKITNMLDNLDPNLAMLLINAIYFNGKWKYSFDKSDTKDEPFYSAGSSSESVPMMHITTELKAFHSGKATIAEIPYGQGNFSMVVVLPDEGTSTEETAGSLNQSVWQSWMSLLAGNTRKVGLTMPRFKYQYKRTLNDDLIHMGMGIAFSDGADFSNMCDAPLMINRVMHQAFIENNEEGTEAAAVTVVEMTNTSINPENEIFPVTLNRPFLYFIRECSTGTILFTGRLNNAASE